MKNSIYTLIALFLSTTFFYAQEKSKLKNVQEETIITTTVTKGLTEETTVQETKKVKRQVIEINHTGVENQNEVYSTKKEKDQITTTTKVVRNKKNDAAIQKIKEQQQQEIKASKQVQLKKHEEERKAMETNRPEKFRKKTTDSVQ